jgi:hypothetical protein
MHPFSEIRNLSWHVDAENPSGGRPSHRIALLSIYGSSVKYDTSVDGFLFSSLSTTAVSVQNPNDSMLLEDLYSNVGIGTIYAVYQYVVNIKDKGENHGNHTYNPCFAFSVRRWRLLLVETWSLDTNKAISNKLRARLP